MKKTIILTIALAAFVCFGQTRRFSDYPKSVTASNNFLLIMADPGVTNYGIWFTNLSAQIRTNLTLVGNVGGLVTNNGIVWLSTNNVPNIALPNGSIATTTNGAFYVRSNDVWVIK
jgi:hypothetical protein